jgi:hypothetical protein
MLKCLKLAAKDLKLPLAQLLSNLGTVHGGRAYTGYVFFAESDLKQLRRNYRKTLRKEFPRAKKSGLDESTVEYFTQFMTNDALESALKPGYVLIDFDGIGNSIRQFEEFQEAEKLAKELAAKPNLLQSVKNFFIATFGAPN